MVTFDPNEDVDIILASASHERTTLTAYFETNANSGSLGDEARKYTYQEFPQHFTWKTDNKKWSIQLRDFAIGRMYFVPPTAGEQFYLRTLLTVLKEQHHLKTCVDTTVLNPIPPFMLPASHEDS